MRIHELAQIDAKVELGTDIAIWSGATVREGASIGNQTSLGIGAYVGPGVRIGSKCKIQNGAQIFDPAQIADGVFIGPGVILTNDRFPRAITPDEQFKSADDWEAVGVRVEKGASIGAGAICVAPIVVGQWASIAAGAVVVKDVPAYAVMAGIPARRIAWVGRAGIPLSLDGAEWICPETGDKYRESADGLSLSKI